MPTNPDVRRAIAGVVVVGCTWLNPVDGFAAASGEAAPPQGRFAFRSYDSTDGLNNLAVRVLLQDRDGLLWAGTEDGLHRYEGGRFRHFGQAAGLPSAEITALHESADGTLWVKDLELRHLPETSATPYRGEGEKVVRSFTFKDRPITQDSLFDSAHGWRYSVLEPTTVRLFELRDPQVEEGRLIFRCRMKSKDAAGVSPSLRIRYPDGVEVRQAKSQPNVAEGTTDWVTYAVSHALRKELRPERVSLEVEMRGRPKDRPFGNEIWIKDVELLQAPAEPIASTTIADLPVPGFFMSRLHRSSDPENTWGYCPAVVMYLGSRPLVCFGVQQRSKEEGRYLYMILFKTGADYAASFGAGSDGHSTTDEAHDVATIELGDQKLEVVYDFQADKQTQKIVREALKINGEEVARGGPHVFLADLTQPVLTLKPIDVPLPAKIPDLADEDHSSWPQTLLTEVFKLSAKSPEIQEFLSTGPVQIPE